jgi:response regulator NasT
VSRSLKIAVADDERDTREFLQELLTRQGHQVETTSKGRLLLDLCLKMQPDLIVIDVNLSDLDGIEAARTYGNQRETPVILITGHHDEALLERLRADHVMACLVKPIKGADVEAAIAVAMVCFGQYQLVRREARDLRQALEDRKLIERAKGVLMKRLGLEEQEAFRRLKRLASDRNKKLADAAEIILTAEEVFTQLDHLR